MIITGHLGHGVKNIISLDRVGDGQECHWGARGVPPVKHLHTILKGFMFSLVGFHVFPFLDGFGDHLIAAADGVGDHHFG
jgi:hypothetical protein